MTKLKCETCLYFQFHIKDTDGSRLGDCKRYPPTVVTSSDYCDVFTVSPTVHYLDFCGEWEIRG